MLICCVQPECEQLQDGLPAATRADTPPHHQIELLARLQALCCCSRPWHAGRRRCASRKRAGPAEPSRQARAATLCRHTCRMLESHAVVSMGRLAEVSRRALPLRDGHQRSSYGAWRPGDGVRSTSHRPCRVAAKICADLLRALILMYLFCSSASRVRRRVFWGRFCTRHRIYRSDLRGHAVAEAAVAVPRAWTALGHREVRKKVPVGPLT